MTDLEDAISCKKSDRRRIQMQLDEGEWISFEDAFFLLDMRFNDDAWKLGGFRARGRTGSPIADQTDIPASAWRHLTFNLVGIDFVVRTPEGMTIYDVQISSSAALPASSGTGAPDAPAAPIPSMTLSSPPKIDGVIAAIVSEQRKWDIKQIAERLKQCGLSITPKGRISGISLADGCIVAAPKGQKGIVTLIMGVYYRDHLSKHNLSNRDVARRLIDLIRTYFANLPTSTPYTQKSSEDDEGFLDSIYRKVVKFLPARSRSEQF